MPEVCRRGVFMARFGLEADGEMAWPLSDLKNSSTWTYCSATLLRL